MQRFNLRSRRKGEKAERAAAKRLGLRSTPRSGAGPIKGDARSDTILQEHKSTQAQSMVLQLGWLRKLVAQARAARAREPILTITFTRPDETPLPDGKWVLIREDYFRELNARSSE